MPEIYTSKLDIHSSIPDVHTSIPDMHTSIPDIHTFIPDIHTSTPDIHTSLPNIQFISGYITLHEINKGEPSFISKVLVREIGRELITQIFFFSLLFPIEYISKGDDGS